MQGLQRGQDVSRKDAKKTQGRKEEKRVGDHTARRLFVGFWIPIMDPSRIRKPLTIVFVFFASLRLCFASLRESLHVFDFVAPLRETPPVFSLLVSA
jgi:hypothetical protein